MGSVPLPVSALRQSLQLRKRACLYGVCRDHAHALACEPGPRCQLRCSDRLADAWGADQGADRVRLVDIGDNRAGAIFDHLDQLFGTAIDCHDFFRTARLLGCLPVVK